MKPAKVSWSKLKWAQLSWIYLNLAESSLYQIMLDEFSWAPLNLVRFNWNQLNSAEWSWTQLYLAEPKLSRAEQKKNYLAKISWSVLNWADVSCSSLCHCSDFNPSWIVNGVLLLNRSCVTLILTYDTFSVVVECWVSFWSDFQNGSRVLKKVL